jgi:hypothetical protein
MASQGGGPPPPVRKGALKGKRARYRRRRRRVSAAGPKRVWTLRLPVALDRQLEKSATRARRTKTGQLIWLLERALRDGGVEGSVHHDESTTEELC